MLNPRDLALEKQQHKALAPGKWNPGVELLGRLLGNQTRWDFWKTFLTWGVNQSLCIQVWELWFGDNDSKQTKKHAFWRSIKLYKLNWCSKSSCISTSRRTINWLSMIWTSTGLLYFLLLLSSLGKENITDLSQQHKVWTNTSLATVRDTIQPSAHLWIGAFVTDLYQSLRKQEPYCKDQQSHGFL